MSHAALGKSDGRGRRVVTGEGPGPDFGLFATVCQLLKSGLYYTRLRRALIKSWNRKVLTDFLVLDDLFLVIHRRFFLGGEELPTPLERLRNAAFAKALRSAERQLEERDRDRVRKLALYLHRGRQEGTSANQVLNAVYGLPRKGKSC